MLPSYNYSYAKARVIGALLKLEDYSVFSEMSLNIESKVYTPDICLYPKRDIELSLPEPVEINELPIIALEVLSYNEAIQDVLNRFDVYFNAFIKSCWLVVPVAGVVVVYASSEYAQRFRTGDIIDDKLNITLPLKDIFD